MRILDRLRWPRSARQAKGHAIVLAVMVWLTAAVVGFTGDSDRGIAGPLKGADFVQFYTLGHLAGAGQIETMYDPARLYRAQVDLVPESTRDIYPPVYPPQAAVIFSPFAGLSYQQALLIWNLVTIVGYALLVWVTWSAVAHLLPDRTLVFAAAAAFPPFWSLVLHGQVTVIVLAAFWAGWLALERRQQWLAGVALGLLALKPQFGIPLAVVVLACGHWSMLAGAIASVTAQAALIWLVLGSDVFSAYAHSIPMVLTHADQLITKPFMSHSLRAITRLVPNGIGLPIWAFSSAVVLWYTVRVWKSQSPTRVRLGVVVLASVLVNPHVIIYDLTVLALPLLLMGSYMEELANSETARRYWTAVYWLFALTLLPTAAAIGLQVSVLVMVGLFALVTRAALDHAHTTAASVEIDAPIPARATA